MKKILCFSGGKDSTAMLITLLENGSQIDDILYVDVGDWMWNEAKDHIQRVQDTLGVTITVLDASDELRKGFERWGFPSIFNRWCTGIKRTMMGDYIKEKYPNEDIIQYIGYCVDEVKRTSKKLYSTYDVEYPLVDANITTFDALKICYDYGFDFGGIYEHHQHFNCWLCPLQKRSELYTLFKQYPNLWNRLRDMQFKTDGYYQYEMSVMDFDKRFWLKHHEELRENRMKARAKYNKRG